MQQELRAHKLMFGFIAVWLLIFMASLALLGQNEHEARVEAIVVLLLTIVVGAALAYVGLAAIVVAMELGVRHRREFGVYVLLGLLGLSLAAILAFTTQESLTMIAMTVAPFPALLGLAQLRLARGLSRHHRQARALAFCGLADICSSIFLFAAPRFTEAQTLQALSLAAILTLVQIVPFLTFQPHDFQHS